MFAHISAGKGENIMENKLNPRQITNGRRAIEKYNACIMRISSAPMANIVYTCPAQLYQFRNDITNKTQMKSHNRFGLLTTTCRRAKKKKVELKWGENPNSF